MGKNRFLSMKAGSAVMLCRKQSVAQSIAVSAADLANTTYVAAPAPAPSKYGYQCRVRELWDTLDETVQGDIIREPVVFNQSWSRQHEDKARADRA